MTQPDPRKELHWLQDVQEAIEKIQGHPQYAAGKQALYDDEYFRVWVIFYIERIGECASRLRQQFEYDTKYPDLDWPGMVGMRRNLVHWYWNADLEKVWQGVEYLSNNKEKIAQLVEQKKREQGIK